MWSLFLFVHCTAGGMFLLLFTGEKKMKFKAINRNTEFIRGYRKGAVSVQPAVVVYAVKRKRGDTRIGITSSKKIGGAVQRNRSRRVIRRAIRQLNLDMDKSYDLIFVARTKTAAMKSYRVASMIDTALKEVGYTDD